MTEITITINRADLRRYEDKFLALAWHLAQANPADSMDKEASDLVEQIGREIVRRWLRGVEPELWHHQGRDHYWHQLTRFAKFDGADWVAKTPADGPDVVHLAPYGLDLPVKCKRPTGKRTGYSGDVTCPDCSADDSASGAEQ